MVRDNEKCRVEGCSLHVEKLRTTSVSYQNEQIRDDWESGDWTVYELASFWGLRTKTIARIVQGCEIKVDTTQLVG